MTSSTLILHSGVPAHHRPDGTEIEFDRGEAGWVFDAAGNRYADFALGFGPVIVGHRNPRFEERLRQLATTGLQLPGYATWHRRYAEALLGDVLDQYFVSFFKTSSEAVTAGVRIANLATNRLGVVRCGYLGWHDVALGDSLRWHDPPWSPARAEVRYSDELRAPEVHNWVSLEDKELDGLLRDHDGAVGCLAIDTYQASFCDGPLIEPAMERCRRSGVLVLADETKMSGRLSPLGPCLTDGLEPDLVVMGKALGNGAPLSLLLGKKELFEVGARAHVGGTNSKELFGIHAGVATMELMAENGYGRLARVSDGVVATFNRAAVDAAVDDVLEAVVVDQGGMFDLRMSPDLLADLPARRDLQRCLADAGVIIFLGHPSFVCLDHEQLDFDELSEQFARGLRLWGERHPELAG